MPNTCRMCAEPSPNLFTVRDTQIGVEEHDMCGRCSDYVLKRTKDSFINIPYKIRRGRDDDV